MLFFHRFDRIGGLIFVTLLFVTQCLAPLIHGHGGYAEPIQGFHMPGFEKFSTGGGRVDIGSAHGFRYLGLELIISVASGIEAKDHHDAGFDRHNFFAPFREGIESPVNFGGAYSIIRTPNPFLHRSWIHQPSRAPPQRLTVKKQPLDPP
ncbi:MAG: hypothetical protein ACRER2_03925 [Methylococcales bacterium]